MTTASCRRGQAKEPPSIFLVIQINKSGLASPFSAGGAQHHPHVADEEAAFLFLCLPKRPGGAAVDARRSVLIPNAFLLLPCEKLSRSWLQHITPRVQHWNSPGTARFPPAMSSEIRGSCPGAGARVCHTHSKSRRCADSEGFHVGHVSVKNGSGIRLVR